MEELSDELPIDKSLRSSGSMVVHERFEIWLPLDEDSFFGRRRVSLAEVEAYNAKIRKKNEERRRRNVIESQRRKCNFDLAPTNISVPIGIIDEWVIAAAIKKPLVAQIHLAAEVQRESRVEAITAKIHGSELSLRHDGSYLWREQAIVQIKWGRNSGPDLELTSSDGAAAALSDLRLQELVVSLFELNIISLTAQRPGARRR